MKLARRAGRRWPLRLLPLVWCLAGAVLAAAESPLEAKVKAAYVYHLIKFVEWPSLPDDAFRVCVRGSDSVGGMLGELANRPVRERPLKIEMEGDLARCQVLYIGRGEKLQPDVRMRRPGLLTVSDQEDFARRGGIVGFYSEGGKVKLEINPEAARAANLRISSKLMELARTVSSAKE
jgi:hypothetical protein